MEDGILLLIGDMQFNSNYIPKAIGDGKVIRKESAIPPGQDKNPIPSFTIFFDKNPEHGFSLSRMGFLVLLT